MVRYRPEDRMDLESSTTLAWANSPLLVIKTLDLDLHDIAAALIILPSSSLRFEPSVNFTKGVMRVFRCSESL
jgi:hypothetical protein